MGTDGTSEVLWAMGLHVLRLDTTSGWTTNRQLCVWEREPQQETEPVESLTKTTAKRKQLGRVGKTGALSPGLEHSEQKAAGL